MAFTAKDVAALREKTGCGMMDCKKGADCCRWQHGGSDRFSERKGLGSSC